MAWLDVNCGLIHGSYNGACGNRNILTSTTIRKTVGGSADDPVTELIPVEFPAVMVIGPGLGKPVLTITEPYYPEFYTFSGPFIPFCLQIFFSLQLPGVTGRVGVQIITGMKGPAIHRW